MVGFSNNKSLMKKFVFDTNCFINATNDLSLSYSAVNQLLEFAKKGVIYICVSLHSIEELSVSEDKAWELAKSIPEAPHWPIGKWKDQVGAWNQLQGTWEDINRNEQIQNEIENLAKSGNDIRDRGAFVDALCSGFDGFVTSDKQFVGSGPIKRLNGRFSILVVTPEDLLAALSV